MFTKFKASCCNPVVQEGAELTVLEEDPSVKLTAKEGGGNTPRPNQKYGCDCESCCNYDRENTSPLAFVTLPAPGFKATAVMPNGDFKDISLSDYKGKYVLLYFWPMDFTFVCPSEIVAFNKVLGELQKRNVQLLGVSTDSQFTHMAWKNTPLEKGGIGDVQYPLVSDISKSISRSYGVLHEELGVALRGLFLIDRKGILRHCLINDLPLGRSVDEAVRVIDALQFTEEHGEVCPANWRPGQKAMHPTAAGVADYLKASA